LRKEKIELNENVARLTKQIEDMQNDRSRLQGNLGEEI
jgi:hypothetical protein